MKKLTTGLLVGTILVPTIAMAYPGMVKDFNNHYKVSKTSELGKARCAACHLKVSGGGLNGYGKDLKAAGAKAKITPAVLKAVEAKDSDGDGINNITEIRNGSNPGSAASPKSK